MLCVELVPRGSGTSVPQTFATIGNTSKSELGLNRLCPTERLCGQPRPGVPSPIQRHSSASEKGNYPSFLSSLSLRQRLPAKARKTSLFFTSCCLHPVYYKKPKYPELKMIMVPGDFLAVFHLPSKCHVFPGIGRASSRGSMWSTTRHCQLRVKALQFHQIKLSGYYFTGAATKRLQFIGTTDRIDEIVAPSYLFGRYT